MYKDKLNLTECASQYDKLAELADVKTNDRQIKSAFKFCFLLKIVFIIESTHRDRLIDVEEIEQAVSDLNAALTAINELSGKTFSHV